MPGIDDVAQSAFSRVSHFLQGSLLYLDAGAGELVAATVGLKYLLDLGVVHICDLETCSARDSAAQRLLAGKETYPLVVLCTQLLTKTHMCLLRLHQAHPKATSSTILCTLSEAAHTSQPDAMLGSNAYGAYLAALKEDLQDIRRKLESASGHASFTGTIAIHHFPLHACTLDTSAFVLPAASSAVTCARLGPCPSGMSVPEDIGDDGLDTPSGVGLKLLAHAIMDIASALTVRLDTFSLGRISTLIGDEICAMPTPVAATETAALVLVDRALDIVTPLAHGDHVMDQIYGMLHRRGQAPSCGNRWFLSAVSAQWLFLRHDDLIYAIAGVGHDSSVLESVRDQMPVLPCRPSDVVVPLPTLFRDCLEAGPPGSHSNPQLTRTVLDDRDKQDGSCVSSGVTLHGSLYVPADAQMMQWREFLLSRTGKDAALFLRKWLREALRKAGISTKMRFKTGSVPVEEFRSLVQLLASSPAQVHLAQLSILQLASAAVAAFGGPGAAAWESMNKVEQELVQLAANGMQEEVAEKVYAMLLHATSSSETAIRLEDALGLACMGLALSHEASIVREGSRNLRTRVADLLVDAVLEGRLQADRIGLDPGISSRLQRKHSALKTGQEEDKHEYQAVRLEVTDKVAEVLDHVDRAASARSYLKDMRRYLEHGAGSKETSCLLGQLLQRIFDHQAIPDLQHNTASIRGLLKSGLGRFGLVQKQPQPGDYATIIVFVVGGVSVADMRHVRHVVGEAASRQSDRTLSSVLLGGTTLISPQDVVSGLFRW